jgi:membrane-associated phospholipid phosphatase
VKQFRRSWWPETLLLAGFVAITAVLLAGGLLDLDVAVRDWSDAHRPALLDRAAQLGNLLGQGGPLTILCALIALALVWRRPSVRPILPVIAAFALTFATLQPLKTRTARPAPHAPFAHPERFGLTGVSYPSGHLVNALVWYGVLALLLAPWLAPAWRRLLRITPPAVLTVTTVYLGYHWLTDTIAGLLLGFLLDRLLHRVPWDRIPLGRWLGAAGWAGPALPDRAAARIGAPPAGAHDPHHPQIIG